MASVCLLLSLIVAATAVTIFAVWPSPGDDKPNLQKNDVGVDTLPANYTIWTSLANRAAASSSAQRNNSQHPQIAFIQSVVVESITFSLLLDRIGRAFGIKLAQALEVDNRHLTFSPPTCELETNQYANLRGDLWYHAGYKHDWMKQCIRDVKFITLLENPITQTLRREMDQISHSFYSHYSVYQCETNPRGFPHPIELAYSEYTVRALQAIDHCVDQELRYNLTLVALAHAIDSISVEQEPGIAVDATRKWTMGSDRAVTWEEHARYLLDNYYLVGTKERFNEFLLLVAMDNDWPLDRMFYLPCRPYERDITPETFRFYFPAQYAKVDRMTKSAQATWRAMSEDFDSKLSELLLQQQELDFQDKLREFERHLAEFQRQAAARKQPRLEWVARRYQDDERDVC